MDSSRTSFTIEEMETYLRCPFRYFLIYERKLHLPPSASQVEFAAHANAIKRTIVERLTPKQHLELFCSSVEAKAGTVGHWLGRTFQRITLEAMKIVSQFHAITLPKLSKETWVADIPYEAHCKDITITGICDLKSDASYLLVEPLLTHPSPWDLASSTRLSWLVNASKDTYSWMITLGIKSLVAVLLRYSEHKHYTRKIFAPLVEGMVSSLRRGAFGRCHPQTTWCCPAYCEFWTKCTGARPFYNEKKGLIYGDVSRGMAPKPTPPSRTLPVAARRRARRGTGIPTSRVSKALAPAVERILQPDPPDSPASGTTPSGGTSEGNLPGDSTTVLR